MKVAVISDLHLGRGDAADRFGHDESSFLRFLDHLESNFERIVLLGDVFETLTTPRYRQQRRELQACYEAHKAIVRRFFERPQYRYVHGNHDLVASNVLGTPTSLTLKADGQTILFTHGHHHDWLLRKARWLSELGVWVFGWIYRMGLGGFADVLAHADMLASGATKDPTRCTFQRWAVALARQKAADVVVTGHTHVGCVTEHGDRLFANSGSCAEGEFSFLALDTKAGSCSVQTAY